MSTPELEVEVVPITELVVDPANARRHSERSLEAISRSLDRFGQRKPIVVHRGVVVAGNGTLTAAQRLGWEALAVVRLPEAWSATEIRAYAVADNRTSDLATWDWEELVSSLGTIGDEELIAAAGYTPEEYDDLIAKLQEGAPLDQDNIRQTPSLSDYGERYADKTTRLLICELPNSTYVWISDRLRDLRAEWGMVNNADVIVRLVEQRFGQEAER